jgi:hypothetical protein
MAKKPAEPWDKPAPKKTRHTKLTPASKAKAKTAAKKAGRKYPSLVDNMNAAKEQKAKAAAKPKKTSASAGRKKAGLAAGKKKATAKTSTSKAKAKKPAGSRPARS